MPGISQGYRGWLAISPTAVSPIVILCRPGASVDMPRNLDTPYPISNQPFGILNYADGLRFPSVALPTVPMSGWFTAANINSWFFTRTSDDLATIANGGIQFSDSNDANGQRSILNPKGGGFTLSGSMGEPIGFTMRFMGTDASTALAGTAPATGLTGTPLQFNAVSFAGAFVNQKITGFTIDLDTGLTPNPELNGTLRPTEINAGIVTARCSFSTNSGVPFADGSSGTITVNGVNFAIAYLVCNDPDARRGQAGRVIRSYTYTCLATTTAYPITVS